MTEVRRYVAGANSSDTTKSPRWQVWDKHETRWVGPALAHWNEAQIEANKLEAEWRRSVQH